MNYYKDSYQKTTSMENIRVVFFVWLTSLTWSRLKDASHEPFTFRWGHPGENMSQVGLQGAVFFKERLNFNGFPGGVSLVEKNLQRKQVVDF